jgi:hypothetical protein
LLVDIGLKMSQTVENAIKSKIYGHGRGWAFTPKDFSGLGSSEAIRLSLFNLEKQKFIRRVIRGVYDYPKQHNLLGLLSPDIDAVVNALAEKNGFKVQPTGAYAANALGLSDQVPGQAVFLTDGRSKKFKLGKLQIILKYTSLKNMHAAGTREAMVIQALKFMQQDHVDEVMLLKIKKHLTGSTRTQFERNLKYAPEWIRTTLFKLMEGEL